MITKEQKQAIRKFERWQERKFAANAKKGWRFFQPDSVAEPTPRSAREAWGYEYNNSQQEDKQEKYLTWTMYAFVFAYLAFLVWREYVSM